MSELRPEHWVRVGEHPAPPYFPVEKDVSPTGGSEKMYGGETAGIKMEGSIEPFTERLRFVFLFIRVRLLF